MSEHNETLADIVAEMRGMGNYQRYSGDHAHALADRIEAAAKRERGEIEANALAVGGVVEASRNKPSGDSAAMREALELMNNLFDKGVICTSYANTPEEMEQIEELYQKAKAALALPRRQCDVGTPEEQRERFILFCYRNSFRGVCSDSCKFANVNRRLGWQEIGQARCFPFWAQMPYEAEEEGGEK